MQANLSNFESPYPYYIYYERVAHTQHTFDFHFSTASNESLSTVENTIAQACAPKDKNTKHQNT